MNFHSTGSGDLTLTFVYGRPENTEVRGVGGTQGKPRPVTPPISQWREAVREIRALVALPGKEAVTHIVGRWRKGKACLDREWLSEVFQLADGRELTYRQLEGQFSNPNAEVAKASLDWLCRIAKESIPPGTELLELYSGFGHNTVALAPYFKHITSVEINRSLADMATFNLEINGIENAEVLRSPAEYVSTNIP